MTQDHLSHFHEYGFAIVPGVFAAGEVAELAEAFERIHAEGLARGQSWRDRNTYYKLADDEALGRVLRYVQWAAWLDETLEAARRDPRLFAIMEPLIGRDIKQIINQMHWKAPGAAMTDFGFHQDSRSRRPREAYRDLGGSYIQTAIAIDPQTNENGAMLVCPKSHLLGELPFDPGRRSMDVPMDTDDLRRLRIDPNKTVTVTMEPGDVAYWHVYTLHGSGPNRSQIDRRLYINGYVKAENCDRGEWAFRDATPCPLEGEPTLVHYEELFTNPGPMFTD